jgi:hypothetical protein
MHELEPRSLFPSERGPEARVSYCESQNFYGVLITGDHADANTKNDTWLTMHSLHIGPAQ